MSQHRLAGFLGHALFVDGFGILLAAFGFLNPVMSGKPSSPIVA
jgi:hypothetical protein